MRALKGLAPIGYYVSACMLCLVAEVAVAAEKTSPLIANPDPLELPGFGRVLFGFVVTVGLAVAIIFALRKWFPKFAGKSAANDQFALQARSVVLNGMRFHMVTVSGQSVLVAEGKTGIAMIILPNNDKNAAP